MPNSTSSSEFTVLAMIDEAMGGLDQAAARRVLAWLVDKYGMKDEARLPALGRAGGAGESLAVRGPTTENIDFATLYARAQPETEKERALVAGYWFQVVKGETDLDSHAMNRELKNLGHAISNITKAFTYLIQQRPQLVIQTRKSGGSQQARKKYRLTKAGIDEVAVMFSRNSAT